MASQLLSAVLQILAFALIPFVIYLITKKRAKGFFEYIGLVKTTPRAIWLAFITSTIFISGGIILAFLSNDIKAILTNPPSVSGSLRAMGLNTNTIMILLIIALFKTSLSEEILFRGFIAKRLVKKLGLKIGNFLQALIFSAVHVLVFWTVAKSNPEFLIFIFLLSGTAGFLIEYINEKHGNGSILPGWIAHGVGNTVSYIILAFAI